MLNMQSCQLPCSLSPSWVSFRVQNRNPPGKTSQALKPPPLKILQDFHKPSLATAGNGSIPRVFPPNQMLLVSWCCLWTSPSPLTKTSGWLTVDMKRILHFCQNRSQLIQKGVQVTVLPIFPGQRNLMEVVEKKN